IKADRHRLDGVHDDQPSVIVAGQRRRQLQRVFGVSREIGWAQDCLDWAHTTIPRGCMRTSHCDSKRAGRKANPAPALSFLKATVYWAAEFASPVRPRGRFLPAPLGETAHRSVGTAQSERIIVPSAIVREYLSKSFGEQIAELG